MYKNFNITEKERQQILEQHKSHGYRRPLNEIGGMYWLTKIKIDSPEELSDEEKLQMTRSFQSSYNGRIAVEFGPNEWYDYDGRIEDIQSYEDHINNDVYGKERSRPGADEFEKNIRQSRRDPDLEEPYDEKFQSFDHYAKKYGM
jgi:hypothetical protein